jgi:hypothetical protein
MPPVSCPPKFTYYGFSRTINPWFEKWMEIAPVDLSKATAYATGIEQMRKEKADDNPDDISDQQMKKAEELERWLRRNSLWRASIVLNFQGSDYFGNERPYDCESITDPVFGGINMYEEECPMIYATFEGQKAVKYREACRTLASHPFFEDSHDDFAGIEKVFEAMEVNGKPEDWTLAVICRAYNLHNG